MKKKKAKKKDKKVKVKTQENFVGQFQKLRPLYEQYSSKLCGLLKEILEVNQIDYEIIERRTKSIESFRSKISRSGRSYKDPIRDITDLSGLRIVLHYLEDVNAVGKLVEREFRVDKSRSSDKANSLRPHEFGYRSVHYVVLLKSPRLQLVEWKPFVGLKAEIQVRTVLQHAWAAVSRTLEYTHENDVPSKLRRRLFRLSGLFEIADEEFSALRTDHVLETGRILKKLGRGEKDIELNLDSLQQYIKGSDLLKSVPQIAEKIGFSVVGVDKFSYLPNLLSLCYHVGLRTVQEMEELLGPKDKESKKYLERQFEGSKKSGSSSWEVD